MPSSIMTAAEVFWREDRRGAKAMGCRQPGFGRKPARNKIMYFTSVHSEFILIAHIS
jgi:hypothetical protein